MSQANYTGDPALDVFDAVEKQLNKVDDLRNLIDLPEDSDFLGYLIYHGESESFLYKKTNGIDKPIRKFSKLPDHAYRFRSFSEANQQVQRNNGESIVALFHLSADQILVAQLQDEGEANYAVH